VGASFDVIARNVRLVDSSPADVLRRDMVGEPSEAAGHALDPRLGRAVGAGRMPASRTALQGGEPPGMWGNAIGWRA
jgi:hypothetical protein